MDTVGVAEEFYVPWLHFHHAASLRRNDGVVVNVCGVARSCHAESGVNASVRHGVHGVERIVESHELAFAHRLAEPPAVWECLVAARPQSIAPSVHQHTVAIDEPWLYARLGDYIDGECHAAEENHEQSRNDDGDYELYGVSHLFP